MLCLSLRLVLLLGLACLLIPSTCVSQKNKTAAVPDFTQGDKVPEGHNHDWNLGPTGARGWIYSNRLETTQARQILITKVDPGSPSEVVIQKGDVILGVANEKFTYDPRVEFGKAIGVAEATDGKLDVVRWRNGVAENVTIPLAVLGSYSNTAPFNCSKSDKIFAQGCQALHEKMKSQTKFRNGIIRSLNTLALLSSGNPDYLPTIQTQAKWAASYSDVKGRSLNCWFYGPINMMLAEYTLATGDRQYMEELERITMEIVNGQSAVGSWGHRFARVDGRLNGYGMMNAPGLPMTVSLVLARKAGVSNSQLDEAIEKSKQLMRFYAGKGSVPYGDHHPWMETHDDNGKNGIAAILFNLLEDREAASFFSHMSVASHGGDRELGHTGNYFNMLWAMPGVALSGPNASGAWMQEFGWYYDLARRWDGTFEHQGPAQPKNDSYNKWDSTGAYLLAYAQSKRNIFIAGKKSGVVKPVDRAKAIQLVEDGKGYSHRLKNQIYADRSVKELMTALSSWSPVVRDRAASALSRRKGNFVEPLIDKLASEDLHTRLGACEALAKLGSKANAAVPKLRAALNSNELWLRVNAADALAAIGDEARVAIPDLLKMLSEPPPESDPRGMQQRYLCFALFDRRDGLLNRSLNGVDRDSLYQAVRAGLGNEDGRARGTLSSVYKNLSYEEIQPLLPAIHHAVAESAPSGIMFADGIRLSGLEVLAKHRIQEGMQLCVDVMELDRWGAGKRIPKCLSSLAMYGTAAKEMVAELEPLKVHLNRKKRKNENDKKQIELLQKTIDKIVGDSEPPELRPLTSNPE